LGDKGVSFFQKGMIQWLGWR